MAHCRNRARCAGVAAVIGALWSAAALADPVVPNQQSECEFRANRFKAQHPHVDPFDYLNYGFFYFGKAVPPDQPSIYRDPSSGTTFYVESDGRHLTAISKLGRLLWVRNPFVDNNMCPYRSAHPYIHWIGPPAGCRDERCIAQFKSAASTQVDATLVKELRYEIARGRKIAAPGNDDRFIGLSFNSSQFGYVDIENGNFYEMGQN